MKICRICKDTHYSTTCYICKLLAENCVGKCIYLFPGIACRQILKRTKYCVGQKVHLVFPIG